MVIRTNLVTLTVIPALAYRQKLRSGGTGITIMRPEESQPGIAAISKTSGEPIIDARTNMKKFPMEAFKEAMALTAGMPYRKQKSVKVTKDMVAHLLEDEAPEPEPIVLDEAAYQKIVDHFTDKNGKLSYDLINKEMIQFAKSSTVVGNMLACGDSEEDIRNYVVRNKFRNIAEAPNLSDEQVDLMVTLIDEVSPKGVFKEFNEEIRKMKRDAK